MTTAVIGRDEELDSIDAFLAEVEHGPSALVLSGEPGIGKTILWEAGVEEAGRRFDRILTCRGVEAEASLSFAALSELLLPVFEEAASSLVSPRRRALEVALLIAEPGEVTPDAHAIGLAVLDVLGFVAERGPVLVALDDVQWLDPASAGVLQIALRRLRQEPIGLVATLRRAPELAAPLELEQAFPEGSLRRLTLGPLSLGPLHDLLEQRLALELTRPELVRVQEATAGNPFFALELGRELVRTNTRTPDDPASARQRRFQAARLHRLGGDSERAVALLEQLLIDSPSGVERADVLFELALTHRADRPTTFELYDEALLEAASDGARSARILAFRSVYHLLGADIRPALADARAALEKAELADDPALLSVTIARVGHAETYAAEITPGLLKRGADIEERLGLRLEHLESPRLFLARLLLRQGEIDRARMMLEDMEAKTAARGDEASRMIILWYLSVLEWLAGLWQRALDQAAAAYELGEQTQHPHLAAWVGRVRALIEADLGLVEQARSSAEEGVAWSQVFSIESFAIASLSVLGRLELALGNLGAAGGYLRELPARLLSGGMNDPTPPVWADAIETLIALGELQQAAAYLEPYELHSRRLGSPLAMEGVLRCRGLLAAADGDLESALRTFESDLLGKPEPPWPFERARTLHCLGMVRRQAQQKKAAREALEQALAIFEELGARLWAEKARAELRRISGRAPSSAELTETERRVAGLAAEGRSNKQIAAELYMGVSTVEAHLSRVYRKLGIRSRAALAGHVAISVDEPAQS
jgi:DNA-binding CsgD family transcriptional regulator